MAEFKDINFSAECISHPALKAIMTFCYHTSVSAVRNAFNPQSFSFWKVSIDDVLKEINKLGNTKAIQSTAIPVKILKQNADIFGSYICHFLMYVLIKVRFHRYWNMLRLQLSLKKDTEVLKKTTAQWLFCLSSPKFSKNYFPTK